MLKGTAREDRTDCSPPSRRLICRRRFGSRSPTSPARARTVDGHEALLELYAHFAADDLLSPVVLEWMPAGAATRRHARTAEPDGEQVEDAATSTSKSAISSRFVRETETALAELMARALSDEDITVLMPDGEHMADRCVVVALATTADGTKLPVGLWEGLTENTTVVPHAARRPRPAGHRRGVGQGDLRRGSRLRVVYAAGREAVGEGLVEPAVDPEPLTSVAITAPAHEQLPGYGPLSQPRRGIYQTVGGDSGRLLP